MSLNKRVVIPLLILLFLLIAVYFLFFGRTAVKALEINFISEYPVASSGESLPAEISVFADKYEDEVNGVTYLSRISYKRLDTDRDADTLFFSKPISASSDPEEIVNMFKSEIATKISTANMFEPKGTLIKDLKPDTTNVRFFYLLCQNNGKVDNVKYFDDPNILKSHINNLMSSGTLFKEFDKPNTVSVILLCGESDSNSLLEVEKPIEVEKETTDIKSNEIKTTPTEIKKTYNAQLTQSGNTLRWNSELKKADRLTITFKSEVDGKNLVSEDVTNQSEYEFNYRNSIYEGSKIKVTLTASFSDGSSVKGVTSLTTTSLECH